MELSLKSLFNLESQLSADLSRWMPTLANVPTLSMSNSWWVVWPPCTRLGWFQRSNGEENHSSQSRLLSTTFSMLALPRQTDPFSRNGRGNGNGNMGYFRPPQNQPGSWATFNLFELQKKFCSRTASFILVHGIAEEKRHGLEQLGRWLVGPPFPSYKVYLHFPKSCNFFLVHHVAWSGPAEQPGSLDSLQQPGASHSLQPQGLNDQQLWPRSAELSFILVIGWNTILAGPRRQF